MGWRFDYITASSLEELTAKMNTEPRYVTANIASVTFRSTELGGEYIAIIYWSPSQ